MTDPLHIESFDAAPDYAANYLRTFFMGEPTLDERFVMSFLAREYATLPGGGALLEVGCGPVIHHVLSAAPRVAHIDMADYREDNLGEIRKWIARAPGAHSWRRFTRLALELEGEEPSDASIAAREDLLRTRIRRVTTCDLRRAHPFGRPCTYPTVACFYTTEQASSTREEWATVFANLAGLVAGGGGSSVAPSATPITTCSTTPPEAPTATRCRASSLQTSRVPWNNRTASTWRRAA